MRKIKVKTGDFGTSGGNFPVKAKVIAGCLLDIYKKKKEITPEGVVTEAKVKTHALHPCFEWNDSKAAKEHRLNQARNLIRCVTVKKDVGGKMTEVRAFVNLRRDEKGGLSVNPWATGKSEYVYIDTAMSNNYLNRYTVERALAELQNLIDKYNSLEQLAVLFGMIKKEIKRIKPNKPAA